MPSKQNQESTQQLEEAVQPAALKDTAYDPIARPIWEQIVEIGAQVPAEEWAQVPSDLSKNLKHTVIQESPSVDTHLPSG